MQRPERDAGLLAAGRADAQGVRRRRVLQLRRLRPLRRSRRRRTPASLRRTPRRRLQVVHRHVGERRPPARARDRALRAAACATPSLPVTTATRSACSALPDVDACRALCHDLPPAAGTPPRVLEPSGRCGVGGGRLASFAAAGTGSSQRITRAMLLEDPPSLDALEVTDKGSLNQRAMLTRRAALVEELYAGSPRVIVSAAVAGAGAQGRLS